MDRRTLAMMSSRRDETDNRWRPQQHQYGKQGEFADSPSTFAPGAPSVLQMYDGGGGGRPAPGASYGDNWDESSSGDSSSDAYVYSPTGSRMSIATSIRPQSSVSAVAAAAAAMQPDASMPPLPFPPAQFQQQPPMPQPVHTQSKRMPQETISAAQYQRQVPQQPTAMPNVPMSSRVQAQPYAAPAPPRFGSSPGMPAQQLQGANQAYNMQRPGYPVQPNPSFNGLIAPQFIQQMPTMQPQFIQQMVSKPPSLGPPQRSLPFAQQYAVEQSQSTYYQGYQQQQQPAPPAIESQWPVRSRSGSDARTLSPEITSAQAGAADNACESQPPSKSKIYTFMSFFTQNRKHPIITFELLSKLAITAILIATIVFLAYRFDLAARIQPAFAWSRSNTPISIPLLIFVNLLLTFLAFPGVGIIQAATAFILETFEISFAINIAAAIAGGIIVSFLARYTLKAFVLRKIDESQRFRKLKLVVENEGPIMTVMLRAYLPFHVGSYMLSVVDIGRGAYLFGSVIGSVLHTVPATIIGSVLEHVVASTNPAIMPVQPNQKLRHIAFLIALVIEFNIMVYISMVVRRSNRRLDSYQRRAKEIASQRSRSGSIQSNKRYTVTSSEGIEVGNSLLSLAPSDTFSKIEIITLVLAAVFSVAAISAGITLIIRFFN